MARTGEAFLLSLLSKHMKYGTELLNYQDQKVAKIARGYEKCTL